MWFTGSDTDLQLLGHLEPVFIPLNIEVGGKGDAVVLVVDSKHLQIRMKVLRLGSKSKQWSLIK